MTVDPGYLHLAAIADANPNLDDDEDEGRCLAVGPDGECCRDRGHYDGAWPVGKHVTFDRDHYDDWPVGWKSADTLVREVYDETFGLTLKGSPDYRRGVEDALRLVRTHLRPGNPDRR